MSMPRFRQRGVSGTGGAAGDLGSTLAGIRRQVKPCAAARPPKEDDGAGGAGADRGGGPVEAVVDALHDGRLEDDSVGWLRVTRRRHRAGRGGGEGEDGEADQDQAGDAAGDVHDGLLPRRSGG
jgi:hypothetical protein